ncbi:TetR/AcrR family transcriptional regulator [Pseudomonas putida]
MKTRAVACDPTDRHSEVLSGALALFARHGYAHVSMRDLGSSLGISAGSLYHHVDSKDALLYESIEGLYQRLLENASQIQQRSLAAGRYLNALIEAHLDLHGQMALHFQVAERDLHYLSEGLRNRILALRRRYEEFFVKALKGLHRTDDSTHADLATGLVLLLNQLPARLGRLPGPALVPALLVALGAL